MKPSSLIASVSNVSFLETPSSTYPPHIHTLASYALTDFVCSSTFSHSPSTNPSIPRALFPASYSSVCDFSNYSQLSSLHSQFLGDIPSFLAAFPVPWRNSQFLSDIPSSLPAYPVPWRHFQFIGGISSSLAAFPVPRRNFQFPYHFLFSSPTSSFPPSSPVLFSSVFRPHS